MDACLEAGVHYMDTANYEPREEAKFTYKWQWPYHDKYKAKGLMAVLGCGFDPGVTNIFCAYAQETLYDEIHSIDIIDCNAGSHGKQSCQLPSAAPTARGRGGQPIRGIRRLGARRNRSRHALSDTAILLNDPAEMFGI